MIRFVDLTGAYWTSHDPDCSGPICAFLSTSNDTFIQDDVGSQTFSSMEEIDYAEFDNKDRLRGLVPHGFFERKNYLTEEEAELAIDFIERMAVGNTQHSKLRLFQRAEKWVRQACDVLRARYT